MGRGSGRGSGRGRGPGPGRVHGRVCGLLRRLLRHPLVRIAVALLALWACGWAALRLAPYAGADALGSLSFSRVYLDRHGSEVAVRPVDADGLRRVHVSYAELPEELPRVIRRAEDARFFLHPGVDPLSLVRAAYQYVAHGEAVSGASTITMQLASMLRPRPSTFGGKLGEMVDALQLETRLSKREIMELYIGLVPMGYNVEGFAAASRVYFGRPLTDLTTEELAILAVVPRSPRAYDPWREPEAAAAAAARVLGLATAARTAADATTVAPLPDRLTAALDSIRDPTRAGIWPFEAPHFVEYLERSLGAVGGWGSTRRGSVSSPWVVATTVDLSVQHHLERLLATTVNEARRHRISNGAGLLVHPDTAEILAYAGSADFFSDDTSGQIDGVQMRRQPGSTLKPFLYAEAFQMGFTPATVVPDIPLEFGSDEVYVPENFNEQFHGPVRVREALAASLNVPAVHTLERISVARFADTLIRLGFTGLKQQRPELGVSLALGGADVSLYELVQGYLSFYADGTSRPLTGLAGGAHRRDRDPAHHWDPATAAMIRDIISTNDDRILTFGLRSPLRFDFPVAIKTGTSNQFTNIWAVGFSAEVAGAIWMGNFSGETVIGTPGSSLPASVLHELITTYSSGADLPERRGVQEVRVCSLSGLLATERCTNAVDEYVPLGARPQPCEWHRAGGVAYPQEYRLWAEQYGYRLDYQEQADLAIVTPVDGSVFYLDPGAPASSQQLRFFLTGTGRGELFIEDRRLFAGELPASVFWQLERGAHVVRLRTADEETAQRIEVR
jgi:penicillin-binding protein 1C